MSNIQVKQLFVHPVKGLTPQAQTRICLQAGHGIPGDRAFGLMYDPGALDNPNPIVSWRKKQNFAMQCDLPGLAALACEYDFETAILTIKRNGVNLLVADTNTINGRYAISAFFTGYLAAINPSKLTKGCAVRLVGDATGKTRYPDREPVHISLVSQATLDQLSQIAGQAVDVRRFRPNIVLTGVSAWTEFDWVGQEIQIGTARLEITAPINRCLNIDVNPDTGERDLALFALLKKQFNHQQTGILAKVITDGIVAINDDLIVR